jgi:predicted nucleic acid-binding protein
MAGHLLDTSVIIDVINEKRGRRELITSLLLGGADIYCCAINVVEVYSGMRPWEEKITDAILGSMEYLDITLAIARRAGLLRYEWARKGRSLSLADATIAAVALHHGLVLATDNRKDFPTRDLRLLDLP